MGAGGAARGALAALCRDGVATVAVLNRTARAAQEMIDMFQRDYPKVACSVIDPHTADPEFWSRQELVINATSLGMHGENISGLALASLPRVARVYDMVYAPPETPLLSAARALGLQAANGLGMLLAQGELAFALWNGAPPPENVMRDALIRHLDRT